MDAKSSNDSSVVAIRHCLAMHRLGRVSYAFPLSGAAVKGPVVTLEYTTDHDEADADGTILILPTSRALLHAAGSYVGTACRN
jgi:hypothetical protein